LGDVHILDKFNREERLRESLKIHHKGHKEHEGLTFDRGKFVKIREIRGEMGSKGKPKRPKTEFQNTF
jgi:hypothetical protein